MTTGDRENDNGDQAKAVSPFQISKSDSDLVWENKEKFQFCPQENDMDKMLNDLPPSLSILLSSILETLVKIFSTPPDYMVMKPFEGGVNFFIEGYLHSVLVKHHIESKTFYFRAHFYLTTF